MTKRIWDDFLTERDKQVYAKAGYGKRGGFGTRPALFIIDVQYNFCGDKPEDILEGDERPATFSCGLPFTFVPVRGPAALGRATVSYEAWARELSTIWAPNLFVFCRDPDGYAIEIYWEVPDAPLD